MASFLVSLFLVAGLLLVYLEPLAAMVRLWTVSPMYSYAFTVPPIAAYLLWTRREEIRREPPKPAWLAGGAVLGVAFALLGLGQAGSIQVAEQFSFLVAIAGLVLLLFGIAHLRLAAPALGYLMFMIPVWDFFTEPLHWPFQNNSARLGVAILHGIGIPAYRDGTYITLSHMTLQVARQCSGVNYLVAVLALALPLAHLRLRGWVRPILLIGSALIVAALANGLRVALIGALVHWDIGSPLHGPFHVLHGLFVAGIGYVVLFAGLQVLENRNPPARGPETGLSATSGGMGWSLKTAGAAALVLWALALIGTERTPVPVLLARPLDSLPRQLGAWSMDLASVDSAGTLTDGWKDADSLLRRRYMRPDGKTVTVEIWYFESQTQGHELVNSQTALLHRKAVTRVIPVSNGDSLTANLVQLPDQIGLFWYELNGGPEASQYGAKLKSIQSTLIHRRNDGAAIVLRVPSAGGQADEVLAALQTLAADVHGALSPHWNRVPVTTTDRRPLAHRES